jgi:DNA-binding NarL/FixJ family response regulator
MSKNRTELIVLPVATAAQFRIDRSESGRFDAVRETTAMPLASIRVLVVDDLAPWRNSVRSMLKRRAELQFVGEVADGLEAVSEAEVIQPELILLDIGLPKLNGIEAAKQIRQVAPATKILFLTLINDAEVALTALRSGGHGYVLKSDAGSALLPAIEAVLQGEQYVSIGLAGRTHTDCSAVLVN